MLLIQTHPALPTYPATPPNTSFKQKNKQIHSLDKVTFSGTSPATSFDEPEILSAKEGSEAFNALKTSIDELLKIGFGDDINEQYVVAAHLLYANNPKTVKTDFIKLKATKHFQKTLKQLKTNASKNKDDIELINNLLNSKEPDLENLAEYVGKFISPASVVDAGLLQTNPANRIVGIKTKESKQLAAVGIMVADDITGSKELGNIQYITVRPEYRQQGLAKKLKEVLLKQAKENGLTYVLAINNQSPKSYRANIETFGFAPMDLKEPVDSYPMEMQGIYKFIKDTMDSSDLKICYKKLSN